MDKSSTDFKSNTKSVLCKYFMHGSCQRGSECHFSHDLKDKPSMVCTFYLAGNCSYGTACRYDHVKGGAGVNVSRNELPSLGRTTDASDIISAHCSTTKKKNELHADAPEFMPGRVWPMQNSSYSAAVMSNNVLSDVLPAGYAYDDKWNQFFGFLETEMNFCEYCLKFISPQETDHVENCIQMHETKMDIAFKSKYSSDKTCGVCLEVIWDKQPKSAQRFGILSGCNHIYCLECIRKWRGSVNPETDEDVSRLCPECRMKSDYVIPSYYWFEHEEEKMKIIDEYKSALKSKPCKYYNKGNCRFGVNCFYLHVNPDGSKGSNVRRYKQDAEGNFDMIKSHKLSDYFEEEENRRDQRRLNFQ